jgi:serine-type D-Ala-D-Ala carboxypeptidase/endopeptidase (penicillin-binding protein 4)
MMKAALVVLLLVLSPAHAAESLASRVQALYDSSPVVKQGIVGFQVVDLASGAVLVDRDADRRFVPASVTKLFTLALGLTRLGPGYRYETTVLRASDGSLILVGAGDPNLSGRTLPYQVKSPPGNPLAAIEELADKIAAKGVSSISGDIIGDDTAFAWQPYAAGWDVDDVLWEYGAPVSALAVDDNAVALSIRPGSPARIFLTPSIGYYWVDNRLRLGSPEHITIERDPGSRQIRVAGTLRASGSGESERLAIEDPAHYAAFALRNSLAMRGIPVRGQALARHWYADGSAPPPPPEGTEIARLTSAPLIESLQVMAKVSQNLHTEMLLRTVGRARRGEGTREAGQKELEAFLADAGIAEDEWNLRDASGLSRRDLVTPAAVVKLLRYMYQSPNREDWLSLLPVASEDGTLKSRLERSPAAGRIRAKTGSMEGVAALAGYADRRDGSTVAFALFSNNQSAPSREVRAFIDKLCILMVE